MNERMTNNERTMDERMTESERATLCRRIDELCAENERLRQENQSIGVAAYEFGRNSMSDENAKMRELVKKLVILAFARCADCDLLDASCALAPTQKCLLWNECESIARELGVEVDG